MDKLKKFCKDHKKELIVAGCVVGAIAIGLMTKGQSNKKFLDVTGKSYLTWYPTDNGFMSLERVKETLDANIGNSSKFAILKEGQDAYIGILIDNDVIMK